MADQWKWRVEIEFESRIGPEKIKGRASLKARRGYQKNLIEHG